MKIAIIGGGIAGSTLALFLSEQNSDITLFEKNEELISGPPFCHLHAGGNLYRDISQTDCIKLLKESIEFLKVFPKCIDYRPTILATPSIDNIPPKESITKLKLLEKEYEKLITKDKSNKVLTGKNKYFKAYNKIDILKLRDKDILKEPKTFDDWMIPFAKNSDLNKLQFPIFIVQEYGINMFRLSATVSLAIKDKSNIKLLKNTAVENIKISNNKYLINYNEEKKFDYIINSTGYKTNEIDTLLGIKRESLIEFKAAYVTKIENFKDIYPEIVFLGERGTKKGMGQLTPYPNGYFQIHGMSKGITLFENGLINPNNKKLAKLFINKLDNKWSKEDIIKRTNLAITHISQYLPLFEDAIIASKPLCGVQQIPGINSSLRTADVTFVNDSYAVCEIVKVSSVISMSKLIINKIFNTKEFTKNNLLLTNNEKKVDKLAKEIAIKRGYPVDLASRVNKNAHL